MGHRTQTHYYLAMFARQDGRCAICQSEVFVEIDRSAQIDHCHATGKVRGILCKFCNLGLGTFKDNIASLERAIDYLKRSRQ